MNKDKKRILTFTLISWVIGVTAWGIIHISRTMQQLAVNPETDTYANELSFQLIVFLMFYVAPALCGLIVLIILEIVILDIIYPHAP